jgi:Ni2+-binding GTPase involved in maturation of urease and hydrogenase
MAGTKQIRTENWVEHLSLFTNGNHGRKVSISVVDQTEGEEHIAKDLPLMAIDYDVISKGDDIVISFGGDSLAFSHTVEAPIELWETHNDKGVVTIMKIIDQNNNECILKFN